MLSSLSRLHEPPVGFRQHRPLISTLKRQCDLAVIAGTLFVIARAYCQPLTAHYYVLLVITQISTAVSRFNQAITTSD